MSISGAHPVSKLSHFGTWWGWWHKHNLHRFEIHTWDFGGTLIIFYDISIIGIARISIHKLLAWFPMKILIKGTDCINGTLMERSLMPRKVNYTRLLQIFSSKEGYEKRWTCNIQWKELSLTRLLRLCFLCCRLDKKPISSVGKRNIPFDVDITIYEETRLLMNHEGCSNSLSEECTAFHRDFGRVSKQYLRNIKPGL